MSNCWLREAGITNEGYSQVCIDGKNFLAHRVSYRLFNGPIPRKKVVRHTCDTPNCINPDHLIVGTNYDNTMDAMARGRLAIGQRHGQTTLTDEQVLRLRKKWNSGEVTVRSLAKEFSISKSCAWNIATRKTWRHLP